MDALVGLEQVQEVIIFLGHVVEVWGYSAGHDLRGCDQPPGHTSRV